MKVIKDIKALLKRNDISQDEIAEAIGVTRNVMTNILNGRTKADELVINKIITYLRNTKNVEYHIDNENSQEVDEPLSIYKYNDQSYLKDLLKTIEYKDQEIRLLKEILESRLKIIELLEQKIKTPGN